MATASITPSPDRVMHGENPAGDHAPQWSWLIEDWADLYESNPNDTSRKKHFTYAQAGQERPVNENLYALAPSQKVIPSSAGSLKMTPQDTYNQDGGGRLWFYPKPTSTNRFMQLHEMAKQARNRQASDPEWKNNYYNRIRMWVKVPPEMTLDPVPVFRTGNIGTYVRATWADEVNAASAEEGGWHYYHTFTTKGGGGVWQQLIVDPVVYHARNATGHPQVKPIGSGTVTRTNGQQNAFDGQNWEQGVNYFDRLTAIYLSVNGVGASVANQDWFVAEAEFYREKEDEYDGVDISTLMSFYNPADNNLFVSWRSNKDSATGANPEAVYSFSSLHTNGWDSGTSLPCNVRNPGYGDQRIDVTNIDMGSNDVCYVAIRLQGDTKFRQVAVPITQAGYVTVMGEKR